MAYRFKKNESLPHAIRRVFSEEIDWAVGQLTTNKKRTQAVHEARKSIKKIRGLLSLIESKLGPLYKSEDGFFGEAGKRLSALRDGAIMLQVFDGLVAEHKELKLAHVRHTLERQQSDPLSEKTLSREVARLLKESKSKANAWPVDSLTFDSLLHDFIGAYRKGRKVLKQAKNGQHEEAIHNLRKKVKHHFYHVRLLEDFWAATFKKRAADLHELETCLGDSNNLSVLRRSIEMDVETNADRQQVRELTALIDRQVRDMQKRGLEMASGLYAVKPREFSQRLLVKPVAKMAFVAKSAVA